MHPYKPIGIFDSGVGGLSVANAIRRALPAEHLHYFADHAYSPYGTQSEQTIIERAEFIIGKLILQGCKAIVIACNTATVNSIQHLRAKFSIPIIGIEPGIKPASLATETGVIGVLATEQTLASSAFQSLYNRFHSTATIETVACPKLVTLVENLEHHSDKATTIAGEYIKPLLEKRCDQIILGCTHFSFLTPTINNILGNKAQLIDTAIPVAKELNRRLSELGQLNQGTSMGTIKFNSSGNAQHLLTLTHQLWED